MVPESLVWLHIKAKLGQRYFFNLNYSDPGPGKKVLIWIWIRQNDSDPCPSERDRNTDFKNIFLLFYPVQFLTWTVG